MKIVKGYYRKITEALPQGIKKSAKEGIHSVRKTATSHLGRYLVLFLVLLSAMLTLIIVQLYADYRRAVEERQKAIDSLSYWEEIVTSHPNFTDAYYNAGIYAAKLGDRQKAYDYLKRAINLDPEFEEAKELEEKILADY